MTVRSTHARMSASAIGSPVKLLFHPVVEVARHGCCVTVGVIPYGGPPLRRPAPTPHSCATNGTTCMHQLASGPRPSCATSVHARAGAGDNGLISPSSIR